MTWDVNDAKDRNNPNIYYADCRAFFGFFELLWKAIRNHFGSHYVFSYCYLFDVSKVLTLRQSVFCKIFAEEERADLVLPHRQQMFQLRSVNIDDMTDRAGTVRPVASISRLADCGVWHCQSKCTVWRKVTV